ncbi:MAG: 3-hydroxybutyryl-CoA dehydrogenase, partial [Ignavibacteria bacterium RBG_16_36_9]
MPEKELKLEDLLESSPKVDDQDSINEIAIIGAGVMGQGIAQTISAAGMDVLLIEKNDKKLKQSKAMLSEYIDREIKRWAMTKSEKKTILSRIAWDTNFDRIADRDLIIEAVDEDFDLKVNIFSQLDKKAKKDCIFVSNTSTLSLTKLAETTSRPDKMIGLHFLNPVPKIPVVEVVKCLHTSNETISKVKTFVLKIGKTPVEVYEYPG